MSRNDELNFEIYVGDLCDEENIKTEKELTKFSEDLHQLVENAIRDYASDNDIEDYCPAF